jgi:hypothetical protein
MPPWTQRCPQGHTNIAPRSNGYRCESCETIYGGDPVDAREVEDFPVASHGELPSIEPRDLLETIVDVTAPETRTRVKMPHLDMGSQQQRTAAAMKLVDAGLLRRVRTSDSQPDWYQPTAEGRRVAEEVEA